MRRMLVALSELLSDAFAFAGDAWVELGRWLGATTMRDARLATAGIVAAVALAVGVVMLIALVLPA